MRSSSSARNSFGRPMYSPGSWPSAASSSGRYAANTPLEASSFDRLPPAFSPALSTRGSFSFSEPHGPLLNSHSAAFVQPEPPRAMALMPASAQAIASSCPSTTTTSKAKLPILMASSPMATPSSTLAKNRGFVPLGLMYLLSPSASWIARAV